MESSPVRHLKVDKQPDQVALPSAAPVVTPLEHVIIPGLATIVPPIQRPFKLCDVERNVGDFCISERQLREKFNELDKHNNGYLDAGEFAELYTQMDFAQVGTASKQKLVHQLAREGKIYFEEFSMLMLKLVTL